MQITCSLMGTYRGRKSQAASTAGRVLGSSSTPGARDIDHEAEMEGGGGDEGKDNKNAKDRSSQVVWGGGSGCRLALASDERQQTVVKYVCRNTPGAATVFRRIIPKRSCLSCLRLGIREFGCRISCDLARCSVTFSIRRKL